MKYRWRCKMRLSKYHKISILIFAFGLVMIPYGFYSGIFPVRTHEELTLSMYSYLAISCLLMVLGSYGMKLCAWEINYQDIKQ